MGGKLKERGNWAFPALPNVKVSLEGNQLEQDACKENLLPNGGVSSWPYQINRRTIQSPRLLPPLRLPSPKGPIKSAPQIPSSALWRFQTILEEGLGRDGGIGKVVTGSCVWQNVTTCLCHTLAITLRHPAGPKAKSETGVLRTKAVLEELRTRSKTDRPS